MIFLCQLEDDTTKIPPKRAGFCHFKDASRLFNCPGRTAVEQVVHVLDLRVGLLVFNDFQEAVVEGRAFTSRMTPMATGK